MTWKGDMFKGRNNKKKKVISSSYNAYNTIYVNLWPCHTANMIVEETQDNRSTELLFPWKLKYNLMHRGSETDKKYKVQRYKLYRVLIIQSGTQQHGRIEGSNTKSPSKTMQCQLACAKEAWSLLPASSNLIHWASSHLLICLYEGVYDADRQRESSNPLK